MERVQVLSELCIITSAIGFDFHLLRILPLIVSYHMRTHVCAHTSLSFFLYMCACVCRRGQQGRTQPTRWGATRSTEGGLCQLQCRLSSQGEGLQGGKEENRRGRLQREEELQGGRINIGGEELQEGRGGSWKEDLKGGRG